MTSSFLGERAAAAYAEWFAALADPTRVRLLHALSSGGARPVGDLAELLGISQSTCSHHVRRLAELGLLAVERAGTSSVVSVDPACRARLPHPVDVVLGLLDVPAWSPEEVPAGVVVRAFEERDGERVRQIYLEGIESRNATFETAAPPAGELVGKWLAGHRWVAEVDGSVAGWAAAAPVSARECYAGLAETSVYVASDARGRGVAKALLRRLVTEADRGGLWTLQAVVFPENRASIALHRAAGFRTVGVRSRIGCLDGVWRDTVLLERRVGGGAGGSGA